MVALRQQQQQQQQQHHHQHQAGIAGTPSPFLQWNMPERNEATLQDFMEQQSNPSQAIVPAQMTRYTLSCLWVSRTNLAHLCKWEFLCFFGGIESDRELLFFLLSCRELVVGNGEASPTGNHFFPGAASQSNLHNLGQIGHLVGSNRGLSIHDMALEQPGGQFEDSQKKAKLEATMGFASSSSSGAAAEGTAETFTNQSEQAHGSTGASNWHQAHHHAQAYTNSQYPNGFFNQVWWVFRSIKIDQAFAKQVLILDEFWAHRNPVWLVECRCVEMNHTSEFIAFKGARSS